MPSLAITATPKNLVGELSLTVDQEHHLQNSGYHTVELHEDPTNTLTADTVKAAAGTRSFALEPRSQTPLRYKVRADTLLWAWASGIPASGLTRQEFSQRARCADAQGTIHRQKIFYI